LPATLNFTGAPVKQVNKLVGATLAFTGNLPKITNRAWVATLSFSGSSIKQLNRALTATLSFGSSTSKSLIRGLVATLSFAGVFGTQRIIPRALAAVLGFTGSINKRTSSGLTAVLNFNLPQVIISKVIVIGTAVGPTNLIKLIRTNKTSGLNFAGSIGTIHQQFLRLMANLNSTGNLTNIRWYFGPFKYISIGFLRAASRAIKNIITLDQKN
jgi:hypothetical protein